MTRHRVVTGAGLTGLALAISACGSSPAAPVAPAASPPTFDVLLVSSVPATGGTLDLASPNDTPVSLSVIFSVTVPPGQAGTCFWTTAVQAPQAPGTGFVVPVVTTRPFQQVTLDVLVAGEMVGFQGKGHSVPRAIGSGKRRATTPHTGFDAARA